MIRIGKIAIIDAPHPGRHRHAQPGCRATLRFAVRRDKSRPRASARQRSRATSLLTLRRGAETADWRLIGTHAIVRAALAGADHLQRAIEIAGETRNRYLAVAAPSDAKDRYVDVGTAAQALIGYAVLLEMLAPCTRAAAAQQFEQTRAS
jgi:transposase